MSQGTSDEMPDNLRRNINLELLPIHLFSLYPYNDFFTNEQRIMYTFNFVRFTFKNSLIFTC